MDQEASDLYKKDPSAAVAAITKFGVESGQAITKAWLEFWMYVSPDAECLLRP